MRIEHQLAVSLDIIIHCVLIVDYKQYGINVAVYAILKRAVYI